MSVDVRTEMGIPGHGREHTHADSVLHYYTVYYSQEDALLLFRGPCARHVPVGTRWCSKCSKRATGRNSYPGIPFRDCIITIVIGMGYPGTFCFNSLSCTGNTSSTVLAGIVASKSGRKLQIPRRSKKQAVGALNVSSHISSGPQG
eukprot:3933867-Rhodomonas_salina.1